MIRSVIIIVILSVLVSGVVLSMDSKNEPEKQTEKRETSSLFDGINSDLAAYDSPLHNNIKDNQAFNLHRESPYAANHFEDFANIESYISDDDDEVESNEPDNDSAKKYMIKKSAPRRIFIGKRSDFFVNPNEFESSAEAEQNIKKRNLLLATRLLNRFNPNDKRNKHINRIFIGKRGDIKRIFIG
jgi:hypothetical protein